MLATVGFCDHNRIMISRVYAYAKPREEGGRANLGRGGSDKCTKRWNRAMGRLHRVREIKYQTAVGSAKGFVVTDIFPRQLTPPVRML